MPPDARLPPAPPWRAATPAAGEGATGALHGAPSTAELEAAVIRNPSTPSPRHPTTPQTLAHNPDPNPNPKSNPTQVVHTYP